MDFIRLLLTYPRKQKEQCRYYGHIEVSSRQSSNKGLQLASSSGRDISSRLNHPSILLPASFQHNTSRLQILTLEMGGVRLQEARLLLRRQLAHLKSPLHPLLSVTTYTPHHDFPATLLHYHLLSEYQLDELAHFYHQKTPSLYSFSYPAPIIGTWQNATIDDKRRRFGRFVGLSGCESPGKTDQEFLEQRMSDQWVAKCIRQGIQKEIEKEMRQQKGL